MIRRALISVADKQNLETLARALTARGVELVSTGGTAKSLAAAGLPVVEVSAFTGAEEILGGRVKTLHPKVHAGILARSLPEDDATLERLGYQHIDLVVVNLYPFRKTAEQAAERTSARDSAASALDEVVEQIDIGGPTMVRSAAKNFARVAVIVDPADYEAVAAELAKDGDLSLLTRRQLASKAFAHTAAYDATIARWFVEEVPRFDAPLAATSPDAPAAAPASRFSPSLVLPFERVQSLRYGENPQQAAALYRDAWVGASRAAGWSVVAARQLGGKELSFNNLLDLDGALAVVAEFAEPAATIIKHTNPCGTAWHPSDLAIAYQRARQADAVSAFGGIVALNRVVNEATATLLAETFLEAVIAPDFSEAARKILAQKKNLRVLSLGTETIAPIDVAPGSVRALDVRRIAGGLLVQDADDVVAAIDRAKLVTTRAPSAAERAALGLAWRVAKHVKSNAIVLADAEATVGVGAGQMSRVDAVQLAVWKAGQAGRATKNAVLGSDAFFPFRDGIDAAAAAGITAVVQPGGSVRDDEVISAANELGLAMLFTGVRHFRH